MFLSPTQRNDVGNRKLLALVLALQALPGSKNAKPDALSRQFSADLPEPDPGPIFPPSCVVGAATWQVHQALRSLSDLGGVPPNTLFVLDSPALMSCSGGIRPG